MGHQIAANSPTDCKVRFGGTRKEKVMSTKFSTFDAAEYLDSEEVIAAYLNQVMAEDDQDLLLSALDDIARARGMSKVAEDAGLTRPSLYKALKPGAKPGFSTVSKIMGALGVRMVAKPKTPARAAATSRKDGAKSMTAKKAAATDKSAAPAKRRANA